MDMRITTEAATLIESLTGASEHARALRIDLRSESGSLHMSLAEEAGSADTVIHEHGVFVFLGRTAARRLRSQTLHASTSEEKAAFYLR